MENKRHGIIDSLSPSKLVGNTIDQRRLFFLLNFLFLCLASLASRRLLESTNFHSSYTHSSLVSHSFMASSTALDKSPFFPPNLSMAFNLSFFSNSSESSTVIRPILITDYQFLFSSLHDSHVLDVLPISKLPYAISPVIFQQYSLHFCHHLFHPNLLIRIIYYMLTRL